MPSLSAYRFGSDCATSVNYGGGLQAVVNMD
jgi:hypothetical protein